MLRVLVSLVAALLLADLARAQERKPALPPGRDPGGVAIAIFLTGIDYTQTDIARRLARDGEGELIGWDVVDNDNRPFDKSRGQTPANWGGDGTELVRLIGETGRRVIPVRIDPDNPVSLARAVAFISRTPARIVAVPLWSGQASDWEPFRQAALRFPDILFLIAAGDDGKDLDRDPVWPAAFGLANVLVVTAPLAHAVETTPNSGARDVGALVTASRQLMIAGGEAIRPPESSRMAAVLAADALAGCWPQLVETLRGEALKRALLAEAAKAWPGTERPVIERCAGAAAPLPKR
ncbi:MAG: hypothetical protein F9K29_13545 [Hyphomicrobiaceae bacterium]|nr:MAG: hypothetical protein F9K29_13545 [Hyphomicrobiaceae bacterium]